jgi:hypothetical protein
VRSGSHWSDWTRLDFLFQRIPLFTILESKADSRDHFEYTIELFPIELFGYSLTIPTSTKKRYLRTDLLAERLVFFFKFFNYSLLSSHPLSVR